MTGVQTCALPISAWTSGGTVAHTIVILSDVKREFTEGETCTGGSSSNTAVVQFNSYGCQGFEQKAFNQTLELLKLEEVVIYEAAFLYDGLFVMTDILVKKGNQVRLIEVKAKSFDSTQANTFIGSRGDIRSGWRPYLFDIAFQRYVAKKCVPYLHFDSFFLMADKSKVATIDGLNQMFRLPVDGDIRKDVEVKISATEAQKTSVLSEVNVTEIVDLIIKDNYRYSDNLYFSKAVPLLRDSYQNQSYSNWPTNYSRCKSCEFKIGLDQKKLGFKSGFEYCFSKQHNWTDRKSVV